jgi:hypothetical protein
MMLIYADKKHYDNQEFRVRGGKPNSSAGLALNLPDNQAGMNLMSSRVMDAWNGSNGLLADGHSSRKNLWSCGSPLRPVRLK